MELKRIVLDSDGNGIQYVVAQLTHILTLTHSSPLNLIEQFKSNSDVKYCH